MCGGFISITDDLLSTTVLTHRGSPSQEMLCLPGDLNNADPDDGTVAGRLRSTGDQDSSREDVANSDMDTASRDYVTCSYIDEVTIQTAWKKYWKRVQASCRISKGSLWTEAQLKRISDSHQAVWRHDHESIQTEWDCTLLEDCNSFEMCRMKVRTDQLLCIAVATDSQIYTRLGRPKPITGQRFWYCH